MRLQKFMAMCGVASRRQSEELISRGAVRVNGVIVKTLGSQVDPGEDTVTVSGKSLKSPSRVYLLFNKPRGIVSTMKDPGRRGTVADFFREIPQRVYPVGRLDRDTEGLLLVTNDGELANRLMHPRYRVAKTYQAVVDGELSAVGLQALRRGVVLEDGKTSPAHVRVLKGHRKETLVTLTLREGKKRQVRRMLEHVGTPVISLKRTGYSFLVLGRLKPGRFRHLTAGEVERLKKEVKLLQKHAP